MKRASLFFFLNSKSRTNDFKGHNSKIDDISLVLHVKQYMIKKTQLYSDTLSKNMISILVLKSLV